MDVVVAFAANVALERVVGDLVVVIGSALGYKAAAMWRSRRPRVRVRRR